MRYRLLPALVLLLALAGCGVALPHPAASTLSVDGNWQIQTASATGLPASGLLLVGALQGSGSNISGTFSFSNLSPATGCMTVNQLITFTGNVDSNSNLTLTSAPFGTGSVVTVDLPLNGISSGYTTGTVAVVGGTCTYPSSPALAADFPPVTGSFNGTLNLGSTTPGQPASGTGIAALTLAQAATPNPSGQFPVTGSVNLTSGTCSQTVSLGGIASGSLLLLSSPLNNAGGVLFSGSESPDGTSLNATLAFIPQLCASAPSPTTFSGQLTRQ